MRYQYAYTVNCVVSTHVINRLIHTRFKGHFPGESGSWLPLIIRGVEASFFADGMPFLSPNQQHQTTEGLMDINFHR